MHFDYPSKKYILQGKQPIIISDFGESGLFFGWQTFVRYVAVKEVPLIGTQKYKSRNIIDEKNTS